jgi:hypothetical protein
VWGGCCVWGALLCVWGAAVCVGRCCGGIPRWRVGLVLRRAGSGVGLVLVRLLLGDHSLLWGDPSLARRAGIGVGLVVVVVVVVVGWVGGRPVCG